MKRALYTGAFRFPQGDAAAFRVQSVAELLEDAGVRVSFAGWEHPPEGEQHYLHQGRDCFSQGEFRDRELGLVARLGGFLLRGHKTLRWLRQQPRYDVVIAYNPPALFALRLWLAGRARGFRVVLDSTEWYEGDHLPGGRYGPAALENLLRMRLVYPLFRDVICISSLLERHFRGRNLVKIPPLSPAPFTDASRPPIEEGVFFLYAGDAGKKDRVLPFLRALPEVQRALGRPVLLRIAGQDQEGLRRLMRDEGMDEGRHLPLVECHGRVPRAEVARLYGRSHFSILFREDKRYARAGFPTKAVESWSHGCPIIANRVGDFGALARDGVDALLLDEPELASRLATALRSVIEEGRYPAMSAAASRRALESFSPEAHRAAVAGFVERLGLTESAT